MVMTRSRRRLRRRLRQLLPPRCGGCAPRAWCQRGELLKKHGHGGKDRRSGASEAVENRARQSVFRGHDGHAPAEQREDAIDTMLWDEAGSQWRDLILDADATPPDDDDQAASDSFICTGRLSRRALASNWMPLWCGVALPGSARAAAAAGSLCRSGLVLPGGVAASLAHSGLQWDFPNAWPPLQHAMVEALEDAGDGNTARAIARAFLEAAAAGLRLDHDGGGEMHEKYDARVAAAGAPGGGGEYAPQVGFGWSNGAALDLLKRYGGIPE